MGEEPAGDEVTRIKALLRENPLGMNIKEISEHVAMSRNSVAKYLDVLAASGHLEVRQMGNAKLYHLSRRIPLDSVINLAREMIVVLDRNLRIVRGNEAFITFTGVPRDRIPGSRLSSPGVSLISEGEEHALSALINGGPDWKKEIRLVTEGIPQYFAARFIPTLFEDGEPGIAVILEDITRQKEMENATRERDRILNALFQITPVPQFMINRNHRVVFWDRALEMMTRIRSEDVLGTNLQWKAFYREERPCLSDLLLDGGPEQIAIYYHGICRKRPAPDTSYECTDFFPAVGSGGRWLRITADVVRDSQGNLVGARETIEDVTDIKEREFTIDPGTDGSREANPGQKIVTGP